MLAHKKYLEDTQMDWQFIGTVVAPIVQAITSLAGVVGLFFVWYQIRITNDWNRANTQHALLSNMPSQELEQSVWSTLEKLPKDEHRRLLPEACPVIFDDIANWVSVKTFLNKHEQLCAAVNAKAVKDRYAYSVHGAKVIDTYLIFENYIEYTRQRCKDHTIYLELEKVATRWGGIAKKEEESIKAEQANLKAKRGAQIFVG
ncbi:MAG: DUF4760 domain-containing protein [Chlorobium sp.]|uniref:DUF4760 domain-containing protein n=1 Tax=Chlorobium sp. TaxID=1095 RepID=UPI002F3E7025